MTSDRGSGSILAVSILAAMVTAVGVLLPTTAVAVGRARASNASDAAALAAADVASGLLPGSPCEAAEVVAAANGATLSACSVDGTTVTVEASVGAGILVVHGVSTAGQPAPTAR
jgi:secretion/DNA translocation related TadE-like protein